MLPEAILTLNLQRLKLIYAQNLAVICIFDPQNSIQVAIRTWAMWVGAVGASGRVHVS